MHVVDAPRRAMEEAMESEMLEAGPLGAIAPWYVLLDQVPEGYGVPPYGEGVYRGTVPRPFPGERFVANLRIEPTPIPAWGELRPPRRGYFLARRDFPFCGLLVTVDPPEEAGVRIWVARFPGANNGGFIVRAAEPAMAAWLAALSR
jgi:hypothetical protein